jgi:hypothetical protein
MDRLRICPTRAWPARTRPDRLLADKAYSNRQIRSHLRRRGIKATIPEKGDQQAARAAKGTVNLVSLLGCGGRVGSAWVISSLCQAAVVAVPVTSVQAVNRSAISRR